MRSKLRTAKEMAQWAVDMWRDAISGKYTNYQTGHQWWRLTHDRSWLKLSQRDREYVHGYVDSYRKEVVDRQYLESGSWVTMPGGQVMYFGVTERRIKSTAWLENWVAAMGYDLKTVGVHRYIHENEVKGTGGIYWITPATPGKYPHFISTGEYEKTPNERGFYSPVWSKALWPIGYETEEGWL